MRFSTAGAVRGRPSAVPFQTQRLFLVDQTCTFSPSYRDHANLRTAPARIAVLRTKIIAVTIAGREFAKATLGRQRAEVTSTWDYKFIRP